MKKKTLITVVLIVLIILPLFAWGGKKKKDENNTTSVESTTTTTTTTNTDTTTTTAVSTPTVETTSISNPIYKIELTEATYITEEDVQSAKEYLAEYYGSDITDSDALEYLINQILFNQAIVRAIKNEEIPLYDGTFNEYISYQLATYASYYGINLTTQEEAESFLSQLGLTYEDFANEVLPEYAEQYFIENNSNGRLEAIPAPTEDEIKEFYNKNITYFISAEAVQLSHIYFDFGEDKSAAKVKADTASKNISNGLTFEDAVKIYTEDEATKETAGAFGVWISADDEGAISSFGENALNSVFKLAVGQVSGVVEGALGYHIFKVTDHKASTLLGLDDPFDYNYSYTVSDIIAQQLYSNKQTVVYSEIYSDIMKALKAEATIKSLK